MKIKPCCDAMDWAVADQYIGIGDFEFPSEDATDVNIYRCHPYTEGPAWDSMEIKFCPFCGKQIEVFKQ